MLLGSANKQFLSMRQISREPYTPYNQSINNRDQDMWIGLEDGHGGGQGK